MKVYLAIAGEAYEGFEILGVFRTKGSAQKALDEDRLEDIMDWEESLSGLKEDPDFDPLTVDEYLDNKYWKIKEFELKD